MKELIIVEEVRIIVDDEWVGYVESHKWHVSGRDRSVMRSVTGSKGKYHERLSRTILGLGEDDGSEVDHINNNTLDNRRENLRVVTPAQNQWNAKVRVDNKSGYRGVWKKRKTFTYELVCNKKHYRQQGFSTALLAARARDRKALELHGEFAYTNFPREQYESKRLDHDYYFSIVAF